MGRRKRYTPEQIASILKQQEKVSEICRQHGISEQTLFPLGGGQAAAGADLR